MEELFNECKQYGFKTVGFHMFWSGTDKAWRYTFILHRIDSLLVTKTLYADSTAELIVKAKQRIKEEQELVRKSKKGAVLCDKSTYVMPVEEYYATPGTTIIDEVPGAAPNVDDLI